MNAATVCHEIPGCERLYVDAFRGQYLKKTSDAANTFILSHYHGDHYGNLPRDYKYVGPALIHCTAVTAALLREVHKVPSCFVMEHAYGETFEILVAVSNEEDSSPPPSSSSPSEPVKITFYDANHCPGAAIILVELEDGTVHLHTGDMRYHEKMRSYPRLKEAVSKQKLDLVLLDTTYGNPKHDFVPQEVAIDTIALQVKDLLGSKRSTDGDTLVLLSCYSIGKEKVLWEVSNRCNQLVYVSARKLEMLKCIEGDDTFSSQIIHRCTREPKDSDIHVTRMGLAGEMFPFFRPNFRACAEYAQELSRQYKKVVAFIPTGWADASNWNKKNAVSRGACGGIDIEVRLISYSEHSSFSELQALVEFLKPRKIVPTVFKDENDARKIEKRFPVDLNRAKKHFIDTMFGSSPSKRTKSASEAPSPLPCQKKQDTKTCDTTFCDEVTQLKEMGFSDKDAWTALRECNGQVQAALEKLLQLSASEKAEIQVVQSSSTKLDTETIKVQARNIVSQPITKFFAPKR